MTSQLMTAFALAAGLAAPVMAQNTATTNMDILRQKIKADKKLVVAENLNLTDAEGAAFWPLYDAYQKNLEAINQRDRGGRGICRRVTRGRSPTDSEEAARRGAGVDDAEAKLKSAGAQAPPPSATKAARPDREQDSAPSATSLPRAFRRRQRPLPRRAPGRSERAWPSPGAFDLRVARKMTRSPHVDL